MRHAPGRRVPVPTYGSVLGGLLRIAVLLAVLGLSLPAPSVAAAESTAAVQLLRLSGFDRQETAAAIAQHTHPGQAETVVLARSDDYADSVSGGPLATQLEAPILLTDREGLSATAAAAVQRLSPTTVVLLGGPSALSARVEADLRRLGIDDLERFAGEDRFETSRLVADAVLAHSGADEAYLVLGLHPSPSGGWPDAVAVAALAGAHGRPILLTAQAGLPSPMADLLRTRSLRKVTVVGGTAAVSEAVADAAKASVRQVDRLAGDNRFTTSLALANQALGEAPDSDSLWLVTGASYADALAAGPAAAARGGIMLLVDGRAPSAQPASDWIRAQLDRFDRIYLMGGPAAISGAFEEALRALTVPPVPPASPPPPSGPTPAPTSEPPSEPEPRSAPRASEGVRLAVGTDLQAAVDAHPPGTTFVIASGVHRLQKVRPRNGDRFIGERGAVLKGSRVLTSFRRDGNLWVVDGQPQEALAHGEVEPGRERDAHPEDLFLDGRRLRHVGSRDQVRPGSWYFDYSADRIYIGDDPGGRMVETSVTDMAFHGAGVRDVVIDNLTISHYANRAQVGAIHGNDTLDWTITHTTVSDNHGVGLRIGPGSRVSNCRAIGNGQLGMGGVAETRGATVVSNEIAHNKQLGFAWGWEGGGTKFAGSHDLVFAHNWVHHNDGPGPWFDIDNVDAVIASNLVEYNTQAGIFYEISYGADIHSNIARYNGQHTYGDLGAGIWVSNSSDVEVHHNLLYGNRHEIMAVNDDRGTGDHGPRRTDNLHVHHNDVTIDVGGPGLRAYDGDTSIYTTRNNRFTANTWRYDLSKTYGPFWWGRALDAAGWQAAGNDRDGTFTDRSRPGRLPAGAVGFSPAHYGPRQ